MGDKNNYARLKEEADIHMVVDALGIPYKKQGSCYFMSCPDPNHNDTHPSAYFKDGWNKVFCNACCVATTAINLIQITKHCDFGEAADFLWELEGRPDWYYAKNWKNKNKQHQKREFSLTKEERDLIGIHHPSNILLEKGVYDEKPQISNKETFVQKDLSAYVVAERAFCYKEDFCSQQQYIAIVNNIVLEKIRVLALQFQTCNAILSVCPEDENTYWLRETILYSLNVCYKVLEKIRNFNKPHKKKKSL